MEYIGILEGGKSGIGGEHTGWDLTSKQMTYQVDVADVLKAAEMYQGQQVKIEGDLQMKLYVTSGPTKILKAKKIAMI